ncbi:hypothetical protein M426DRAFT_28372 [Hypoxylon sp. CI-4A]|nr:hypothetical protein M426DRAFT_28372 [Hypoxylon sp. CI-4A]
MANLKTLAIMLCMGAFPLSSSAGFPSWVKDVVLANDLTHYDVLGIPNFSTKEEIEQGYNKQLMLHVSDKVVGGKDKIVSKKVGEITASYEFLTSIDRCIYDYNLHTRLGQLEKRTFYVANCYKEFQGELWPKGWKENIEKQKRAANSMAPSSNYTTAIITEIMVGIVRALFCGLLFGLMIFIVRP